MRSDTGTADRKSENRCHRYKVKSYWHFAAHCSVTAKAQRKFTRYQNVERYRRLLTTALIVEEQQKQKAAGDSAYQR